MKKVLLSIFFLMPLALLSSDNHKRKAEGGPEGQPSAKRQKIDASIVKSRALIKAVKDNNLAKAQDLIQSGADINYICGNGKSALIIAILEDFTEIQELLMNHSRLDLNAQFAQVKSLDENDKEVIFFDVFEQDRNAIMRAILRNGIGTYHICSDQGKSVVQHMFDGRPINYEMFKMLIEYGMNLNMPDSYDYTTLYYIICDPIEGNRGQPSAKQINLLLKYGVLIDDESLKGASKLAQKELQSKNYDSSCEDISNKLNIWSGYSKTYNKLKKKYEQEYKVYNEEHPKLLTPYICSDVASIVLGYYNKMPSAFQYFIYKYHRDKISEFQKLKTGISEEDYSL